ncbi:hypothetical protein GCM10016455_05670 [Aliiroseovarius zhejiangensis]|uniref:Mor transcription activator domain-containing protein n=1 Tax=Aliiroseovarius zhejiangensis TaxID=1632025 RepID=A0ABQ3IQL6_9RHOB|nr:hypothetical protein [Aliiroseovarius zhejiangensis]GHE88404.1 hypothetical protein GCM10016455_05670 [Aliiroseovarius zhejiangensis]
MMADDEGDSVFDQIADVLGEDRALIFIGTLPAAGNRPWRKCFHVPKRLSPNHWLVARLGWSDAQRMVRSFGGMILQPSNVRYWGRDMRNKRVVQMFSRGATPQTIAAELGISEARVRELIDGRRVSRKGSRQ